MIDRNDKKIYNCPNCAAPIGYSPKCEYCGTVLHWIPACELKTVYVNVRKLRADAVFDNYVLRMPGGEKIVFDSLKARLAERLPEVWKVEKFEDFNTRDEVRFRATVLIGREDNG